MARAVAVASGTADVAAVAGDVTVVGCSVRESAALAAVATVLLRDGTSVAGTVLATVELAGDESKMLSLPGVQTKGGGVFVDRVAGETELVIYLA